MAWKERRVGSCASHGRTSPVRGVSAIIPDYLHRKAVRMGKHNIRSLLGSVNR